MIRITHHRHKCIGCNACVEAQSYRWRVSKKDGKCNLIDGEVNKKKIYTAIVDDNEEADAKRAAKNCPVNIIRVEKM